MKNYPLLLPLILALSGCAATGEAYAPALVGKPSERAAEVVVYRPGNTGSLMGPYVLAGGKECNLGEGSFFSARIPAGPASVKILDDKVDFSAKAGATYYVQITQNISKADAGAAGGLIGVFLYNATQHGTANDADWFFNIEEPAFARQQLAGTHLTTKCK